MWKYTGIHQISNAINVFRQKERERKQDFRKLLLLIELKKTEVCRCDLERNVFFGIMLKEIME